MTIANTEVANLKNLTVEGQSSSGGVNIDCRSHSDPASCATHEHQIGCKNSELKVLTMYSLPVYERYPQIHTPLANL